MIKRLGFLTFLVVFAASVFAQSGTLRGFVYNAENGTPIVSALVTFKEIKQGAYTDDRGFYTIANIPSGTYNAVVSLVGFSADSAKLEFKNSGIISQNFYGSTYSTRIQGI